MQGKAVRCRDIDSDLFGIDRRSDLVDRSFDLQSKGIDGDRWASLSFAGGLLVALRGIELVLNSGSGRLMRLMRLSDRRA
jgi:hypothetical protein